MLQKYKQFVIQVERVLNSLNDEQSIMEYNLAVGGLGVIWFFNLLKCIDA